MSEESEEVLVYRGSETSVPDDVIHIRIHPSVTVIPRQAFGSQLEEDGTFDRDSCKRSLEIVELHDGITEIGDEAFMNCEALKRITLPEGLESIGDYAFRRINASTFRMPPLVTTLPQGMIESSCNLVSFELPNNTNQIDPWVFSSCVSLRNISIPRDTNVGEYAFDSCTDLIQVIGRRRSTINALRHRFDNLPIHEMIYYQSYNNVTVDDLNNTTNMRHGQRRSLRRKLDPSGKQQDCLGMTPLHILACSTGQNIELYRVLIEKYPENLTTKDQWGALPLLYAVWSNVPDEIIQFLVESYQSIYPDFEVNWIDMIDTMGRINELGLQAECFNTTTIETIFKLQKECFPEQQIDLDAMLNKLILSNQKPINQNAFILLVQYGMTNRINAIGIKQFRDEITDFIENIDAFNDKGNYESNLLQFDLGTIRLKLANYEIEYTKLKDATAILELALWKSKINDHHNQTKTNRRSKKMKVDKSGVREQCRIKCGADIVIPHVLPYLLPKVNTGGYSGPVYQELPDDIAALWPGIADTESDNDGSESE